MSEKKDVALSNVAESTSSDERVFNGIVFSVTDGDDPVPPVQKLLYSSNAYKWFKEYPEDVASPAIKLLTRQISSNVVKAGFDIPFSKALLEEAIWQSHVYTDWSRIQSGACAAFVDFPARFILQTPNDGYPFVSLALSCKGHICKGVYTFDHGDLDPAQIMPGETIYSGWRTEGYQIISMPSAILRVHSAWMARQMSHTLRQLQAIEEALAGPYLQDFSLLQRTLHLCQDEVLNLERRSEFESLIIAAIENVVGKSKYSKNGSWPALAPAKAAIQLRRAELAVIPRRIESARIAINDTIMQRTQLQSLLIAQSTQRIAEATMNDSASMKTIAILTMIFLPGTAVASFFSMTMWDWNTSDGTALVNPWLWIYFAVATPLTLGVVGFWYFWMMIRTRRLQMHLPTSLTQAAPPYTQSLNSKRD